MIKLNSNQQKVLDTFINKRACFVNASAGTGKTTTLIKSYVALLERGERVEDIVVITFTKAAANEMLIRVRSEIRARIKEESVSEKKEYWQNVYSSIISSSNITTIHAFAQKIVSENALYLGTPSVISILEENNDFFEMLQHTVERILETSDSGELIYSLYQLYILDNRISFIDNILNFINSIKPRLESIISFEKRVYSLIESKYKFEDIIKEFNIDDIDFCINYENKTSNAGIENVRPIIDKFKLDFEKVVGRDKNTIEIEELKTLYKSAKELSNSSTGRGKIKKDFASVYKPLKELSGKLSISLEPIYYKKEIDTFILFLREVYIKVEDAKKRNGVYSHDDIISIAINALEDENIKNRIRESVKCLILDEAQDTSRLQYNFINLLIFGKREIVEDDIKNIGDKRLFIVGDRKQSIYRFRDANVEEFLNIEKKFSGYNAVLRDNYRSSKKLLDFFNELFQKHVFVDDMIKYNDDDNLVGNEKDSSGSVIDFLAFHDEEKIKAQEGRELESNAIALYAIENLKNEYKDSTILLSTFSNLNIYLEALSKYSIPFYVEGGRGFYQRIEIIDIMTFLYYLFLFDDSILDLLLTLPFFEISIDEIFSLKTALSNEGLKINDYISIYKEKTIEYHKAKNIVSTMPFFDKLENIKKIINELERTIHFLSANTIIENICTTTNYYAYLASRVDAEMSISNIEKLKDLAKEYEHATGKTAYDFVIFIKKSNDKSLSLSQVAKLDIDAMRIMTIHKSKGLEFKNTFFASMGSRGNNQKSNFYFIDDTPVITLPVSKRDKIVVPYNDKNESNKKDKSEKRRLLYVALTRASDKLILSGESSSSGTYRDIFDSFFSIQDNIKNQDNNKAGLNILSSFENSLASLYTYNRSIKTIKKNTNNIESINIDNSIIIEQENNIKQDKKIYVNTASGSKEELSQYTYDLNSLIESKAIYIDDYNNIIEENNNNDDIKLSPADLGSAIHSILENFDFDNYKKDNILYINKIKDVALLNFRGYNKDYISTSILAAIDNYLKDTHIKNILNGSEEIIMREGSFQKTSKDSNLNINIMKGKIDLITKDKNNNYYVIDYKVALKNADNEKKYNKQINIYKELISLAWDIDSNKIFTYIMYLK